jgi:transcriptional regulator with XRE-family HTH domain
MTIRKVRRERGWSQETLADLARLDRSYMSAIERGLRNVSVLNLARLAAALQVPVRELLDPQGLAERRTLEQGRRWEGPGPRLSIRSALPLSPDSPAWTPGRYLSLG